MSDFSFFLLALLAVVSIILVLMIGMWVTELVSKWIKSWRWRRMEPMTFDFGTTTTWSFVDTTSCCGMCELYGLQDGPVHALAALARWQQTESNYKPLVVFSDNMRGHGQSLAEYIRSHRLGRVYTTRSVLNPNSGNRVQAWIWRINRPTWEIWVRTHIRFADRSVVYPET